MILLGILRRLRKAVCFRFRKAGSVVINVLNRLDILVYRVGFTV